MFISLEDLKSGNSRVAIAGTPEKPEYIFKPTTSQIVPAKDREYYRETKALLSIGVLPEFAQLSWDVAHDLVYMEEWVTRHSKNLTDYVLASGVKRSLDRGDITKEEADRRWAAISAQAVAKWNSTGDSHTETDTTVTKRSGIEFFYIIPLDNLHKFIPTGSDDELLMRKHKSGWLQFMPKD